jgi:hypothetical protein
MGLYPISCPVCKKSHLWFSGNLDTRCSACVALDEGEFLKQLDKQQKEFTEAVDGDQAEFLDKMDRFINKTPLACGHLPCSLGGCKNCKRHCSKGNCP